MQPDRGQPGLGGEALELVGDPRWVEPFAVLLGKHPAGVGVRLTPREPFLPLAPAVRLERLHRLGVQRDHTRSAVRLGRGLLDLPAVLYELPGDGQQAGVQVGVGPALSARLAAPQAPESDQVVQGVEAMPGRSVEELPGLFRGPHHDRARLLSRALPLRDALPGPHQGFGAPTAVEFDVGGWIEGDELLRDGVVQRGAERGPDSLAAGRTGQLSVWLHLGQFGAFLGQSRPLCRRRPTPLAPLATLLLLPPGLVLRLDLLVGVLDGVEHLDQVPDAQPVKRDVPDPRFQMHPDARLIAAHGRVPPPLASQPLVKPGSDRHADVEGLPGAEAALRLLVLRYRFLLGCDGLQQIADSGTAFGIVVARDSQQRPHLVEIRLRLGLGRVAAAPERASRAVLVGRQFLPDVPQPVTLVGQLRAGLSVLLAGLWIAAGAASER